MSAGPLHAFITTDTGLLAVSEVVHAREAYGQEDALGGTWILTDRAGRTHRWTPAFADEDIHDLLATVLPAQPGQDALVVAVGPDGEAWVRESAVIGWRVLPHALMAGRVRPEPVLVTPPHEGGRSRTWIAEPDGSLTLCGSDTFVTAGTGAAARDEAVRVTTALVTTGCFPGDDGEDDSQAEADGDGTGERKPAPDPGGPLFGAADEAGQRAEALRLKGEKRSIRQIAAALGVGKTVVERLLREAREAADAR